MQKDLLGQDLFLIGRPGPMRRNLVMQYLELTQRELEYVALSRDTTESDLKQRREIRAGTAHYIDQAAVRAASLGRILVLEGIEKVTILCHLTIEFRVLGLTLCFRLCRPRGTCCRCSIICWRTGRCTWKMGGS